MGPISTRYAPSGPASASTGTLYTVTFYALRPDQGEVPLTVHRVERDALRAYTGAPGMVLETARSVRPERRADGFRVVCPAGKVVLDYIDQSARG